MVLKTDADKFNCWSCLMAASAIFSEKREFETGSIGTVSTAPVLLWVTLAC
jgi:hypothetical protein